MCLKRTFEGCGGKGKGRWFGVRQLSVELVVREGRQTNWWFRVSTTYVGEEEVGVPGGMRRLGCVDGEVEGEVERG